LRFDRQIDDRVDDQQGEHLESLPSHDPEQSAFTQDLANSALMILKIAPDALTDGILTAPGRSITPPARPEKR
jgi:hypothetical protein